MKFFVIMLGEGEAKKLLFVIFFLLRYSFSKIFDKKKEKN